MIVPCQAKATQLTVGFGVVAWEKNPSAPQQDSNHMTLVYLSRPLDRFAMPVKLLQYAGMELIIIF